MLLGAPLIHARVQDGVGVLDGEHGAFSLGGLGQAPVGDDDGDLNDDILEANDLSRGRRKK